MTLFSPASLKLSPSEETQPPQTVDSGHSTGFQSKVNPDMIALKKSPYDIDSMLMILWHHKCNDIQSTSHPMTVILPSHGTTVVFSVIDLRWSMIDVFYDITTTMFVALSPLWWRIFSSGQYQVRLHNNCVYSKIGLFLEALKQQRRMSITIQSITSLTRNGQVLFSRSTWNLEAEAQSSTLIRLCKGFLLWTQQQA